MTSSLGHATQGRISVTNKHSTHNYGGVNAIYNRSYNVYDNRTFYNNWVSYEDQLLSKLSISSDAAFNSAFWQHSRLCLWNTRVSLLEQIKEWSKGRDARPIYWLSGMAGTGKSTISLTLAKYWSTECQLGASFFFSRTKADLSNTSTFLTTIAVQLANSFPRIKPYICHAIEMEPDINTRSLPHQWSKLVLEPLCRLRDDSEFPPQKPLIFVIDALDECNNQDDVLLVIRLLSELNSFNNNSTASSRLRVQAFLSSRPEVPIKFGIRKLPAKAHEVFVLHEVDAPVVRHDIATFIKHELELVRKERLLPNDWPQDHIIHHLARKSGGLFIYAATICRFVRYSKYTNPEKRLILVLQDGSQPHSILSTEDLDKMYIQVLKDSFIGTATPQEKEDLLNRFKAVVGTIILLTEPLTPLALATLLQQDTGDISDILENLNSLIEIKAGLKRISVLHISFRDFLLDRRRCTTAGSDVSFWIDAQSTHNQILQQCLVLMKKYLRKDICELKDPGINVRHVKDNVVYKYLPLEAQYAVCNWIGHFLESTNDSCNQNNELIIKFLETHFLYWIEALSLLRKVSIAAKSWSLLQSTLKDNFIDDAGRFLQYYNTTIKIYPLQLYSSALIFSPKTSCVRSRFEGDIPNWIKCIAGGQQAWTPVLQTLEGHSHQVVALAFSPNGMVLASASKDCTVRLWDPLIGSCHNVLKDHSKTVYALAFSPDSTVLASGSADCTVRLWDSLIGSCQNVLKGHSKSVVALAFSTDGTVLASGSMDYTIRLWDPLTGCCQNVLEGHSDWINALAYSPDGGVLASASNDRTVRLWYLPAYACQGVLEDHTNMVNTLAFSPDGRVLASASFDEKIKLWDPLTGGCQRNLEGHSQSVNALAFSPNGRLLASGSTDCTIRIWDPLTGDCQSILQCGSGFVQAIAFSPDGKVLASGSENRTITLWGPFTNGCPNIGKDSLDSPAIGLSADADAILPEPLVFSPDGMVLASGSFDYTVRLWDPLTGYCVSVFKGHSEWINALAYSPDGKVLASGSMDCTVRLWNPLTGYCQRVLKGHSDWVHALAYSPDGRVLASASSDCTIRLWDPLMGSCQRILEGHSDSVTTLVLSQDGRVLASGSSNNVVRLWDMFTGCCQSVLNGHSGWVHSLAVSPDGKVLASGSFDRTVMLWDLSTSTHLQTLTSEGIGKGAASLSFCVGNQFLQAGTEIFQMRQLLLQHNRIDNPSLSTRVNDIKSNQDWMAWNGYKIVWIPLEYRPFNLAYRDGLFVFTRRMQLMFIKLDIEKFQELKPAPLTSGTNIEADGHQDGGSDGWYSCAESEEWYSCTDDDDHDAMRK